MHGSDPDYNDFNILCNHYNSSIICRDPDDMLSAQDPVESMNYLISNQRCDKDIQFLLLPAATARWSINAVFPSSSPPSSAQRTIEHGVIETNDSYESY